MPVSRIECTIEGTSALLMHRFPMVPIEAAEKLSPEEQAEHSAFRIDGPASELFVPALNLQRAFVAGATFSKGKGRGSLQKPVAASVQIVPERLGLGQTIYAIYAIDSRPVVIPATKGRVLRYWPRIEKWELNFTIEFDPTLIKPTELRRVVDDTGSRVGLLDFRPEKKGPFGRFMVTRWQQ